MSDADAGPLISRDGLNRLVELFGRYEGALDPLSSATQEAEYEFNALVENPHRERVLPIVQSIPLWMFQSHVRRQCRIILSKQGPPYPCIGPKNSSEEPLNPGPPP